MGVWFVKKQCDINKHCRATNVYAEFFHADLLHRAYAHMHYNGAFWFLVGGECVNVCIVSGVWRVVCVIVVMWLFV